MECHSLVGYLNLAGIQYKEVDMFDYDLVQEELRTLCIFIETYVYLFIFHNFIVTNRTIQVLPRVAE